jgi:hypothetical protein
LASGAGAFERGVVAREQLKRLHAQHHPRG